MGSVGGVGAVVYAVAVTEEEEEEGGQTRPGEAAEKRHHLPGGRGYTNPWESYVEVGMWDLLVRGMFWYILPEYGPRRRDPMN